MADVAATVADEYGADLHCIYADDNADQWFYELELGPVETNPKTRTMMMSGNCSDE